MDVLRALAIVGAMSSHAFSAADAYENNTSIFMMGCRLIMTLSTPIFICLFGAMLEIVYRSRLEHDGPVVVTSKLLSRALQCYSLYVLSVFLRVVIGDFSVGYGVRCALLMGVTPFSDILKFYALVLFFSPWLLKATDHPWGLRGLVACALTVHCLYLAFKQIPHPPSIFGKDYLNFPAGFLYGGAAGPAGPSLIHGLTLVVLGIVLGRLARRLLIADPASLGKGRACMAALIVALSLTTMMIWPWPIPVSAVADDFINMVFRNDNHPLYFAIGATATCAMLWLALEIYDVGHLRSGSSVIFVSSTSLFTFSFGNMLLAVAPSMTLSTWGSIIYGAALLAAVLFQSWVFFWSLKKGRSEVLDGRNGLASRWARLQAGVVGLIDRIALKLARPYAHIVWPRLNQEQ